MKEYPIVSGVLSMDAFARCWVQEFMLFDEIAKALPTDLDAAFESVRQKLVAAAPLGLCLKH